MNKSKVLIIGAGKLTQKYISQAKDLEIIGILDNNKAVGSKLEEVEVLGKIFHLEEILTKEKVDEIVQAGYEEQVLNVISLCRQYGIKYKLIPNLLGIYSKNLEMKSFGDLFFLELKPTPLEGWGRNIKRLVDIFGSVLGLIILSPLFLILAILLKIEDLRASVFISEKRYSGYLGEAFDMYKFRTLPEDAKEGWESIPQTSDSRMLPEIKEHPQASKLGRFLRQTEISELPQLFNVLAGQMSLVGPRPPYPQEVSSYDKGHLRRLIIKPGVTGLWQISHKYLPRFEEMFRIDTYYIENWSLWLDFKILILTFFIALTGRKMKKEIK